jgi:hypothetical protein
MFTSKWDKKWKVEANLRMTEGLVSPLLDQGQFYYSDTRQGIWVG